MILVRAPSRPHIAAASVAAMLLFVATQAATPEELPKNFVMRQSAQPVPAIDFADSEGRAHGLAEFKGRVVVLNVWATWCVPCRTEMPALDRLQASLGGPEFAVVPISIDRGGAAKVAGFYSDIGIQNLAIYVDASGNALRDIGAVGLPTTLILDRAGREIGRIVGPAEWDDPAIVELLRRVVATPADVAMRVDKDGRANATAGPSEGGGSAARGWRWLKTLFSK